MTITERLLATIVGGLAIWLVTMVISHLVKKARLRAALLADIEMHLAGAKEQRAAAAKLIDDHVIEGKKLSFPISYNIGEYLLYKSIQKDLPEYLSKTELVKVVKFYQALWELDVSVNGLASTIGIWERDGSTLSKEHVAHAKKRKQRIDSFCDVLTAKNVNKLVDLPDDYRSVKNAETVVTKT